MEETIKQLMADILDLDPKAIDHTTRADGVDGWDSFNHLNLCLAIEQALGVQLEVQEMETMLSFPAIMAVVRSKE